MKIEQKQNKSLFNFVNFFKWGNNKKDKKETVRASFKGESGEDYQFYGVPSEDGGGAGSVFV